jgi:SAM-dependent methyltransferase
LFPARSFDLVVDIESSFYYPDKLAFIRGVHHVIKDDGLFVLAFYI